MSCAPCHMKGDALWAALQELSTSTTAGSAPLITENPFAFNTLDADIRQFVLPLLPRMYNEVWLPIIKEHGIRGDEWTNMWRDQSSWDKHAISVTFQYALGKQ